MQESQNKESHAHPLGQEGQQFAWDHGKDNFGLVGLMWGVLLSSFYLSVGPGTLIGLLTAGFQPNGVTVDPTSQKPFDVFMREAHKADAARDSALAWVSSSIGFALYLAGLVLALICLRGRSQAVRIHGILGLILAIVLAVLGCRAFGQKVFLGPNF
jgi:hypothetical protein